MRKLLVDTTKVSERGQVVIPKDIRDRMRLTKGTKLLVVATEDAIILQKLETKEEGKMNLALPLGKPLPETLAEVEKTLLREALEQTGYVQTRAAKLLGIDEKSLRYKRQKYGL